MLLFFSYLNRPLKEPISISPFLNGTMVLITDLVPFVPMASFIFSIELSATFNLYSPCAGVPMNSAPEVSSLIAKMATSFWFGAFFETGIRSKMSNSLLYLFSPSFDPTQIVWLESIKTVCTIELFIVLLSWALCLYALISVPLYLKRPSPLVAIQIKPSSS